MIQPVLVGEEHVLALLLEQPRNAPQDIVVRPDERCVGIEHEDVREVLRAVQVFRHHEVLLPVVVLPLVVLDAVGLRPLLLLARRHLPGGELRIGGRPPQDHGVPEQPRMLPVRGEDRAKPTRTPTSLLAPLGVCVHQDSLQNEDAATGARWLPCVDHQAILLHQPARPRAVRHGQACARVEGLGRGRPPGLGHRGLHCQDAPMLSGWSVIRPILRAAPALPAWVREAEHEVAATRLVRSSGLVTLAGSGQEAEVLGLLLALATLGVNDGLVPRGICWHGRRRRVRQLWQQRCHVFVGCGLRRTGRRPGLGRQVGLVDVPLPLTVAVEMPVGRAAAASPVHMPRAKHEEAAAPLGACGEFVTLRNGLNGAEVRPLRSALPALCIEDLLVAARVDRRSGVWRGGPIPALLRHGKPSQLREVEAVRRVGGPGRTGRDLHLLLQEGPPAPDTALARHLPFGLDVPDQVLLLLWNGVAVVLLVGMLEGSFRDPGRVLPVEGLPLLLVLGSVVKLLRGLLPRIHRPAPAREGR
mmetsp:Transcript_82825/g.261617  ORF Transcript_82825/g.261617 Transcript_82825/m.261617 type:complete len:528 (+) Transcript_82825:479-2062(+)